MENNKQNCQKCQLSKYSTYSKIVGKGSHNPDVIMIGEAPGPDEAKQGKIFIGQAGKKLDEMCTEYSQMLYFTNIVKCRPCNLHDSDIVFRTPTDLEIELCKPKLLSEILILSTHKTPLLMPLGNIALQGLIGKHKGITKEIGILRRITLGFRTYKLLPNYHPSYILRNPEMEKPFMNVLKQLKKEV